MNTNQPFFRSEMTFNKAFRIDKIAKCIYDISEQKKWDKNIIEGETFEAKNNYKCGDLKPSK